MHGFDFLVFMHGFGFWQHAFYMALDFGNMLLER
jgi:hypothetical protein